MLRALCAVLVVGAEAFLALPCCFWQERGRLLWRHFVSAWRQVQVANSGVVDVGCREVAIPDLTYEGAKLSQVLAPTDPLAFNPITSVLDDRLSVVCN